ncbi:hypothetical protein MJO29_001405 [Puccinia striiformis f. sp. tritici]|nr:hypothetical protein MJO29_001405 [Puccinia striiformis f. sp. tritici]
MIVDCGFSQHEHALPPPHTDTITDTANLLESASFFFFFSYPVERGHTQPIPRNQRVRIKLNPTATKKMFKLSPAVEREEGEFDEQKNSTCRRKRNRGDSASSVIHAPERSDHPDQESQQSVVRSIHTINTNKHAPPMNYYYRQLTSNITTPTTLAQQHPAKKRRKGVAGAILSTALDAALFTSAIGYAAYQFWRGKDLDEEEEESSIQPSSSPKAILTKSDHHNHHQTLSSPPPPPYEPRQPDVQVAAEPRQPPVQLSRRSLRSTTSRPSSSRPHSSRPTPQEPINFILRPNHHHHHHRHHHQRRESAAHRVLVPTRGSSYRTEVEDDILMGDFVCSLDTYIPSPPEEHYEQDQGNDIDDDEEDDEEMKAFKAQIQGLIQQGQAALASRPTMSYDSINQSTQTPTITSSSSSSDSLVSQHLDYNHHHLNRSVNVSMSSQNHSDSRDHHHHNQQLQKQPVDENVRLLQLALEKAASKPKTNWWE